MKVDTIQFQRILLIYLIAQPIIDLLVIRDNFLPSIIRGLFLLICVYFLIKIKQARFYIFILTTYSFIHMLIIYFNKSPVFILEELTYLIKTVYFFIFILTYRLWPSRDRLIRVVLINMALINVVMLIAELTNSGKRTYEMLAKAGHTGWFFSGNELSVIVAIGLCFIVYYLFTVKSRFIFLANLTLLIIHVITMLTIGTKVSLFSLIIILLISIVSSLVYKANKVITLILTLILITVVIILPKTPAGENTNFLVNQHQQTNELQENDEQAVDPILSGRRDFLSQSYQQFRSVSIGDQLFGLGYGGHYLKSPKLVEMDGFDLLFGFGVIGFLIFAFPVIKILIIIAIQLKQVNIEVILLGTALILATSSAFVAGHVFSAPAASIYLVLVIGLLWGINSDRDKPYVLVLTTMYPSKKNPSFGVFVKNQVELLRNHQIKVDVLSIKSIKMGKANVIKKYTGWIIRFLVIFVFYGDQYDVVHAHYVFPSGWLARLLKKIYRCRMIVTAHGGDVDRMPSKHRWIALQCKKILYDADHIIAVSEALKAKLRKKFNVDTNRTTVLNMGVNRTIFKPGSQTKARAELNLPIDKKIILFVGNLIKAKGLEELLDACQALKITYQCHLVGANKEPKFLEELLHGKTIPVYIHQPTNQMEIAKWYRAADIFVLPSHLEGFGLAALEAMACRIPVVGTAVGGLRYLLDDNAGLIVPAFDSTLLKAAIEEVLFDKSLANNLVNNGQQKAEQYDQEKLILTLIKLYTNKELSR